MCHGTRESPAHAIIVENPELIQEDKKAMLIEIAAMGVPRCPRCQFITIKAVSCLSMMCKQCQHSYILNQAEKVETHRSTLNLPGQAAGPTWQVDSDDEVSDNVDGLTEETCGTDAIRETGDTSIA